MSGLKTAVLEAIGTRFLAQARVDAVDSVSDQFRLITLSSEKFTGVAMRPAAKIRLNVGNWEMRAYTPLALDAVSGRFKFSLTCMVRGLDRSGRVQPLQVMLPAS